MPTKASWSMTLLLAYGPLASGSVTPLATERLDLSQYKVEIISEPRCDGSRYAYLLDSEGYLHRVEAGDMVGHDAGSIVRINPTNIEIVEVVQDKDGHWVDRKVVMPLEVNDGRG